jgi:hypothetical protein
MTCDPHEWRETGRRDTHVEFTHILNGQHVTRRCFAIYVSCRACKQVGFRKPASRIVYTWAADVV